MLDTGSIQKSVTFVTPQSDSQDYFGGFPKTTVFITIVCLYVKFTLQGNFLSSFLSALRRFLESLLLASTPPGSEKPLLVLLIIVLTV